MKKLVAIVIVMIAWLIAAPAAAQTPPRASTAIETVWTPAEGDWVPMPDIFPKGGMMKVINGNPATGGSELYFRFPAGFGVPWHFHTPTEKVLMNSGTMRFETRSGRTVELGPGGYIMAPPRAPHRATCISDSDCFFFLVSDAPFDIHLVDANWNTTASWYAAGSPPARRTTNKE